MVASPKMQAYFSELQSHMNHVFEVAQKARAKGFDPDTKVEIVRAANMAERVVGLISVVAPQVRGSGIAERIMELEKEFGSLDWRVAFKIAEEIALGKFCVFSSKKEAIEVGIRVGFAYVTVGVVSSPLDGLVCVDLKKRVDGSGDYLSLKYAGPVRNAGGTAAAVSVLIGDYVRKKLGISSYDPTPEEIKRTYTEVADYHERCSPRQYIPSEEELSFIASHLPVEINADASEDLEVSNYKDLPRVETNKIRSGFCLIMTDCIPLKTPKLWKQLSVWGKSFDMSHWSFLEEVLVIQKKYKSKGGDKKDGAKISPDHTYLKDLVAGRPVLSFPLAKGGFRLRYGRSRVSGFSGQCVSPVTMAVLNDFLAIGTQLKVERPGKAAAFTSCDLLEGPVVKLDDGSVVRVESVAQARLLQKRIVEILFLGDVLINYGDFLNRAHALVPVGYCEEWWRLEVEKVLLQGREGLAVLVNKDLSVVEGWLSKVRPVVPLVSDAFKISRSLGVPLHPYYTLHWNDISREDFVKLLEWFSRAKIVDGGSKIVLPLSDAKRFLEVIGCPHVVVSNEFVVIEPPFGVVVFICLGLEKSPLEKVLACEDKSVLSLINMLCGLVVRDKSGTYVGARMGRPEKAKQRKMTGSPHVLFPVGEEGGKMRSFQSALEVGFVTADFANFWCAVCNVDSIYPFCVKCGSRVSLKYSCRKCNMAQVVCPEHGPCVASSKKKIPVKEFFNAALSVLGLNSYPDLIKGVRGVSNQDHIVEHLAKGILRAQHDVFIFRDGTVRYDCGELPMTHFKPKEIGTSVDKLRSLGYDVDIHGLPLESVDQILELKPQDVVLPSCPVSNDEPAEVVVLRIMQFVDDLLVRLYGLEPFYNVKSKEETIGQLIIGLAPHTSAGLLGRIIGYSKTQGFLCHPYFHAACRRDCDGDEIGFLLLMDAFLNFSVKYLGSTRGASMDAPLVLTSVLNPAEVDDMAFDVDVAWEYPLELYEAALSYKMPWEVKVKQIKSLLGTPAQFEGMGFTHDTVDINNGVLCSAYKTLASMEDKLKGQMDLAEKIRAVDSMHVATLVIEKHFIKDSKGNLRKFSTQGFRCVNCNEKYRRPPLLGKCLHCKGRIIFTVSYGNIMKYVMPMVSLANRYGVSPYLKQTIGLLQARIEGVFGRDKEVQTGLGAWFG